MDRQLFHKRCLVTVLLCMVAWPWCHYLLVKHADVNPWKLFGFAMYCTVHEIEVELWDETSGHVRLLAPRVLSDETNTTLARFIARRQFLGRLQSPREFAATLLRNERDIDALRIKIGLTVLSPDSQRLETTWRWYRYERQ